MQMRLLGANRMSKYFGTFKDIQPRDELFGGGDGIPVSKRNIEVGSDTTIQRGMLLGSAESFGTFSAASSDSAVLVIAAEDFVADSDHTVTQAYTSGKFNREKIKLSAGLNIDSFEEVLRREDIILTSIKDIFGHVDDWAIGN